MKVHIELSWFNTLDMNPCEIGRVALDTYLNYDNLYDSFGEIIGCIPVTIKDINFIKEIFGLNNLELNKYEYFLEFVI